MAFKFNVSKVLVDFMSDEKMTLVTPISSVHKFWEKVQNKFKISLNDSDSLSVKELDEIFQECLQGQEKEFTVRDFLFMLLKNTKSNQLEIIFSLLMKLNNKEVEYIELIQEEKSFLLENLKDFKFDPMVRSVIYSDLQNEKFEE